MFKSHGGARGRWFREQFGALEARFGLFDSVARHYAAGVAVLWCDFRQDTLALEEAENARRKGRGRRPSTQAVARLKRRQGLSWGSYDSALRRLEELMVTRGTRRPDPLAAVREAVAEANR